MYTCTTKYVLCLISKSPAADCINCIRMLYYNIRLYGSLRVDPTAVEKNSEKFNRICDMVQILHS